MQSFCTFFDCVLSAEIAFRESQFLGRFPATPLTKKEEEKQKKVSRTISGSCAYLLAGQNGCWFCSVPNSSEVWKVALLETVFWLSWKFGSNVNVLPTSSIYKALFHTLGLHLIFLEVSLQALESFWSWLFIGLPSLCIFTVVESIYCLPHMSSIIRIFQGTVRFLTASLTSQQQPFSLYLCEGRS